MLRLLLLIIADSWILIKPTTAIDKLVWLRHGRCLVYSFMIMSRMKVEQERYASELYSFINDVRKLNNRIILEEYVFRFFVLLRDMTHF